MIWRRALIGLAGICVITISAVAFAGENPGTYEYYLNAGLQSFKDHDDRSAYEYLNKAHVLSPSAEEPLEYINLLKRIYDGRLEDISGRQVERERAQVFNHPADDSATPELKVQAPPVIVMARPARPDQPDQLKSEAVKPANRLLPPAPAVSSKQAVTRTVIGARNIPEVISLDRILTAGQTKPTLRLDVGAGVIIEGKGVQRFLEVDPGFIQVKAEGRDQIRVEGKKWGSTFLHIWDDRGRTTLYIEVILPHAADGGEESPLAPTVLEHTPAFKMNYNVDRGTYSSGPDNGHLHRRSMDVQQSAGLEGQTPYGYFDASGSVSGFAPVQSISTYTVGMSHVPLKGVNDLNLRVFDATRSLSPLTMPTTRLRGQFVDIRAFEDVVGLSVGHGQQLSSFAFYSHSRTPSRQVFVDAVQVSLFPFSQDHRYVLNMASGYGDERETYLTKKVVSVQGQQKVGKVDLNAELARDDRSTSGLAGIKWANGLFHQALNFRDISKKFTTVTAAPANQGEIGATWSTNMNGDRFSSDSFVDVYQDRLYPNEGKPDALNYDTNAHTRVSVGDHYAWDTTGRYVFTPGESSPRRYESLDTRITRDFPVWGGRKGYVYAGGSDQRSRFTFSPAAEYDRYALVSGFQIPVTRALSGFMNYEYSWLFEKSTSERHHPAVTNAGLMYNKDLTEKLVGSLGLTYRNEQSVKGTNSFLAGEDSVAASAGLTYTPKSDVNLFCDVRMRSVWSQIPDGASYNDLDVRVGMRMVWGVGLVLDPLGTVEGYVYKDRDGNKKFETGAAADVCDEGLPGVRVRVGDKEATTDERGWYSLPIRARKVLVTPVMESLPPGFVFSTPASAKVDIVQGAVRRIDFGLTTQSGVYGIAFVDQNGNGIPDQNDRFVGRVKLLLDGAKAQVTDSHGAYFFKNISQGRHAMTIDMASLPVEFIPQVKIRNEVDVTEGTTYIFHIPLKVRTP